MDTNLINSLVQKALNLLEKSDNYDLEKACWMIIHEYHHGIMPFEYDIREIDETIYLSVLQKLKEKKRN